MRIVNVMISRVMGGIEQALLDYNDALTMLGYDVLSVVDKRGVILPQIQTPILSIKFNKHNLLLLWQLYRELKKFAPDIIIVHQKKAIPMFKMVAKLLKCKIIGVAHNPKIKRLEKCDAVFSVTHNQAKKMQAAGLRNVPIFVIPNMIKMPPQEPIYHPYHQPIVIGAMGRFEPLKGFGDWLDALAILKQQNVLFKALLGGGNNAGYYTEEQNLHQKVKDLGLQDDVEFCGWVNDKQAFFNSIDIFVLPSHSESFGIVLLEAAVAKKPIICSDAEGPAEVWDKTDAALLFERHNATQLAKQLKVLLQNPQQSAMMADNAYKYVEKNYSVAAVAHLLQKALQQILEDA